MSDLAGTLSRTHPLPDADEPWLFEAANGSADYTLGLQSPAVPAKPTPSLAVLAPGVAPPVAGNPWARPLDVVGALVLIILLAPVFIVVSVAIFVFDPGPVIFRHQRIGQDGKPFPCLKFRSMFVGAEQRLQRLLAQDPDLRDEWERDFKLAHDPRVTLVGRFLRVTSIDELPQLVNVVAGQMSLVGPRPIVAAEVIRYGRYIYAYHAVKPGLTGLWQVSGRSATHYRRRVAMDVVYARSRSVSLDLKILLATFPAVIACRGAA